MKISHIMLSALLITFAAQALQEEHSIEDLASEAVAICRGTVHTSEAFLKPNETIHTRTGFTVLEALKGTFAETVRLEHPGGKLSDRAEIYCGMPNYKTGREYLLFLIQRPDGTLLAERYYLSTQADYANLLEQLRTLPSNGTDVSGQTYPEPSSQVAATVGVLPGTTGYGSRFLQCDRGEPIEYLVDIDALPTGISSNQAMTALSNALASWEAVTSLKFKFAGHESFGTSANAVSASDGRIRIQLHDLYGYITSSSTLGRGGRGYTYNPSLFPGGGLGAKVGANEFDLTTRGYLVIEHTHPGNSNPVSLEEVIAHELGHVLSLGHSSETPGESDPVLSEALMYYTLHGDGRGASLNSWDTTNILDFYPLNTPPYGYDRIIRALSSVPPQAPLSSGVNQVGTSGFDLQGPVTASIVSSTGSFSLEPGNIVFYEPGPYYTDSAEAGPGSYYDVCYLRFSDGLNLSPPVSVRVIQLLRDYYGDHLPDTWVTTNNVTGGPSDDDDSDGLTNLDEWFIDSDPKDPLSNLQIALTGSEVSWNTRVYELYHLQSTTSLTNGFSNIGNPVLADDVSETLAIEATNSRAFFRVQRLK